MPLLSRSLRPSPSLRAPPPSLFLSRSPPSRRSSSSHPSVAVSLPEFALSATSNVLRQTRPRSHANVLPPPPLTVLFLLRNLASSSSSHSYSCSGNSLPPARRRTLLHFLRAFSPPRGNDASNAPAPPPLSFPHASPHSLPSSCCRCCCWCCRLSALRRASLQWYNPRVFYYRVSRNNSRTYHAVSPQGFFICWLRSREFANNCAQTFPQNAPQGDVKRASKDYEARGSCRKTLWILLDSCKVMCDDSRIIITIDDKFLL